MMSDEPSDDLRAWAEANLGAIYQAISLFWRGNNSAPNIIHVPFPVEGFVLLCGMEAQTGSTQTGFTLE